MDLTRGGITRPMLLFAGPMIAGNLLQQCYNIADTLIVGRALGASAMYGYQFYNMQQVAKDHGWTPFSVMENHYNLLYREDEHELIPICKQFNVSLMPYSSLASGHLTRPTWNSDSKRSHDDPAARGKYDHMEETDLPIVKRVAELADRYQVKMADVALAW